MRKNAKVEVSCMLTDGKVTFFIGDNDMVEFPLAKLVEELAVDYEKEDPNDETTRDWVAKNLHIFEKAVTRYTNLRVFG